MSTDLTKAEGLHTSGTPERVNQVAKTANATRELISAIWRKGSPILELLAIRGPELTIRRGFDYPRQMEKKGLFQRFLDKVEYAGNKLPDPVTLFAILIGLVLVGSWIGASTGVKVIHPADGKEIMVQSLLTAEGIRKIFTEMVKNFAAFPPLGLVIVTIIGVGVAEKTGLIGLALKRLVTAVPPILLPATVVFAGIMSNIAADAGYVVLTPLGAVLFAAFGRHPIAGLAAAFAGVSGGFSANLLVSSLDPLLGGISTKAAQIVDPTYEVQATANFFFLFVSTFVLTIVGTLVTTKIVEPRLGPWKANQELDRSLEAIGSDEKRGLVWAGIAAVLFTVFTLLLVLPEGAPLRDEKGELGPFYQSIVVLTMLVFLICGVVYGIATKQIRSDKDVAILAGDSVGTLGGYIVLAFVASQFIGMFTSSNMGLVTAISGANFLKSLGIAGVPLLVGMILVSASINLLIGSASAKWAIMAPVFVPMLMMMGISPEATQAAYRVGDSTTNIICPTLPYLPIILAFAKKYDPRAGLGTIFSVMLPYSVAFLLTWTLMFVLWVTFGIPLGPDVSTFYSLPIAAAQ